MTVETLCAILTSMPAEGEVLFNTVEELGDCQYNITTVSCEQLPGEEALSVTLAGQRVD